MKILIFLLPFVAAAQSDVQVPDIRVYGAAKSSALDAVPTVSEMSGQKLRRKRQTTLGETLARETGVTASYFGPNASRPVIRGQDGDRVRLLQNGVGVLDASAASQDHAVAVEPLTIEKVEVVRGPGTLLYGSGAVGGVVNVTTNRIPEAVPEKFNGRAEGRVSSNEQGRGGALSLNSPAGKRFAVHADGAMRASDDYRSGDTTRVHNSQSRAGSAAGGVSYAGERGFLGTSYNQYESTYGTVIEEFVHINMIQRRWDIEGEARDVAGLKSLRGKFSSSEYKHDEIEEGSLGTTFKNRGSEGRLEFRHQPLLGFSGLFGVQANQFTFSAVGEETFLPDTENENQALFVYEEREIGRWRPSLGLRVEEATVTAKESSVFGVGQERNFSLYAGALGVLYQMTDHYALVLNGSLTERAPNYQELFAGGTTGGPHVATGMYEQGDRNLRKEKSQAVELSVRHKGALGQGSLGVFLQDYEDYIVLAPTGTTFGADSLPVFNYGSSNARFYGAELEYRHNVSQLVKRGILEFELKFDWLRGINRDTGHDLPRVTPMRETLGLLYRNDKFQTDLEIVRVERQSHTAPDETSTSEYSMVNIGYEQPMAFDTVSLNLFVRANNVFDTKARNHVSLIKDSALLPGRNFIAGVQTTF